MDIHPQDRGLTQSEIDAQLAEIWGRFEGVEAVYNFYKNMKRVYLPGVHPALVTQAQHGMGQIKAWLMLTRNDLHLEAETNLRTAYEHMLVVQWWLWTNESDDQIVGVLRRKAAIYINKLNKIVGKTDEPLDESNKGLDTGILKPERLAERFSKEHMGQLYADLSQSAHPSMITQGHYEDGISLGHLWRNVMFARIITPCLLSPAFYLGNDEQQLLELTELCVKHGMPVDLAEDDREDSKWRPGIVPVSRRA